MTLNFRPVSQNFQNTLYKTIEQLEGPTTTERWWLQIKPPTPTIGVGFDLKTAPKGEVQAVFRQMGFDISAWPGEVVAPHSPAAKEQQYIGQLLQLAAAGNKNQSTYDAIMKQRAN